MSLDNHQTVPFEIPEIDYGFKEASGLMKLWERGLELEFEVATLGLLKSGVETVRIGYEGLRSIEYKKGWISDKIILEGKSMKVFEDVPGTEIATCTLKIKRKYRNEGQNFVSKARMHLSEHRLNQMDEDS